MVDDVRRDDAETGAHSKSGESIVARRVEGVVVVEELDDDVLAAEPLDEPVELPGRRTGTGFDECGRNRSLATARQDEEVASSELRQSVEVVARTAFLATGEMGLTDGTGEARVALRIAGEDDQVGPGRVGDPGTWCRRGAAPALERKPARDVRAVAGKRELSTEHGRHSRLLSRLGKAHHAVEAVVVCKCQSPEPEPGSLRDELLGIRGTVEETEVRMAVELCVPDHATDDSDLSNVCS